MKWIMNILFILAMMNEKHTRERKWKKKCRVTVSALLRPLPLDLWKTVKTKLAFVSIADADAKNANFVFKCSLIGRI